MDFSELTRRPDPTHPDCWQIFCGDVHVGTIAKKAAGGKAAIEWWHWRAGFYAGTRPGEIKTGKAISLKVANVRFYRAWLAFAASRTEADFQALRDHIEWTRRKYAALDNGERAPSRQ